MKKLLLTLMLAAVSSSTVAERVEVSSYNNDPEGKISSCIDLRDERYEDRDPIITLRGYLAPKTAHHPVQGKFTRTVLVLEQAICVEDCITSNISEVQVINPENLPDYGRPVTVTGIVSMAYTGWHLTPIMVYVDSIELLPRITTDLP
jgi:hypothetical protein